MTSAAFSEISLVLGDHFGALYHCDIGRLALVSHPQVIYATADLTPLLVRTMGEYPAPLLPTGNRRRPGAMQAIAAGIPLT